MTRHNDAIVALPEGGQHAVADGGTVLSVSAVLRNAVGNTVAKLRGVKY
jgi:hypothetical protein